MILVTRRFAASLQSGNTINDIRYTQHVGQTVPYKLSIELLSAKELKGEFTSSTIKFYELCQSCLASHCVTVLNCNKVEMAQAKTGGLSCV